MIRRAVVTALGAALLASVISPRFPDQARAEGTQPELKLKVGDVAPDFKLKYFDGSNLKDVSLSDYRGKKNVVVAFYIFAFTGG
jgi:hypothetical protein